MKCYQNVKALLSILLKLSQEEMRFIYVYSERLNHCTASMVQWSGFHPSKVEVGVRFTVVASNRSQPLFLCFFQFDKLHTTYRSLDYGIYEVLSMRI